MTELNRLITYEAAENRANTFFVQRPSMYDHNLHGAGVEISLALEAAEVLELRKLRDVFTQDEYRQRLASELADVMVYAFTLAEIHSINLPGAIMDKVIENEKRFPQERFQGDKNDFIRQYYGMKKENGERS